MTKNQETKLQGILQGQPDIGRRKLADLGGVTEDQARTFLNKVRGTKEQTVKAPAPPDPFEKLSDQEKKYVLKSMNCAPPVTPQHFKWGKESIKFAALGDTHWAHKESKLEWWQRACDLIEREKCDIAFHTGDITEGMSPREGHVYEIEAIGASAQLDFAANRMKIFPCDMFGLNGNHDLWGFKRLGFDLAKSLEQRCSNFHNLGMHEADFPIGNIIIKLWHGEDGASYATSYRTQKFVEGISGGEKPNILLAGHDHKAIFHMCRNVAVFGTGTLCGQTQWMRNKKLAAHVGFWIIEVFLNERGIERIKPEFIPFFV